MDSYNIYLEYILKAANDCKYTKWYYNIIRNSLQRASTRKCAIELIGTVEGHHIFPKSICSKEEEKDIRNMAFLTPREHFISHLLLSRMFSDKRIDFKMKKAVGKFFQNAKGQDRKLNSVSYELARRASVSAQKLAVKKFRGGGIYTPEVRKKMSDSARARARREKIEGITRPSGRSEGLVYMHNMIRNIRVKSDDVIFYKNEGYILGKMTFVCEITHTKYDFQNWKRHARLYLPRK